MHNQTWKEFIWAPDLTWLIIFLKLVTLAIMILKSGSSTDRGRSNCTASFISRISSAFCPDEIRESWKQKHTNKDVIFQIFQRGIKVRNTQNTKEPRGILGKELVCVSGHHLFFLSVFNIVGDELDKLGAESPEGGVPMDHQLFLDPVTVFPIYRGIQPKVSVLVFIHVKLDALYRSRFVLHSKCLHDKFYYAYRFVKVWCI